MWSKSSLLLLLFCFLCIINISTGFPKSYRHPRQEKQQHRLPDHGLMDDSYGGLSGGQMKDGQQRDGTKGYGNIDLDALGDDKKGGDSYGGPSDAQMVDGQQQYGKKVYDALGEDKKEGGFDMIFGKQLKDVMNQIKQHGKKGYGSADGHQHNDGRGNGVAVPATKLSNPGLMFGPPSDDVDDGRHKKEAHGRFRRRYNDNYETSTIKIDAGAFAAWSVVWILVCIVLPITCCCGIGCAIAAIVYCCVKKSRQEQHQPGNVYVQEVEEEVVEEE